jgi:amidase
LIKQGEEPEVESVKRTNLAGIPGASLQEYFALNAARSRVKNAFQQFWLQNRLDALVYPPAPTTATPLDEWQCITYTMLWNILDYPAVVIPTGKVCDSDSADGIENALFGPEDKKNYSLCKYPTQIERVCEQQIYANDILQTLVLKSSAKHHSLYSWWACIKRMINSWPSQRSLTKL